MKKYEIIFWTSKRNGALNYCSIESNEKEITDFHLPSNIVFVDVRENIIVKDRFNQDVKKQKKVKCYYFGYPATIEEVRQALKSIDKNDLIYKVNLESILKYNDPSILLYRGIDNRIRCGSKRHGELISPQFINNENKYTGYSGKDYFDLE